jgi:hypothetical protein
MGYDLHITRRKDWSNDEPDISLAEWEAYVSSDPELRLTGIAETPTPDGLLQYKNAGLAVWVAHPSRQVWFDPRAGGIAVKNPDEITIDKMVAIARRLRAHVQGDDGETYTGGGQRPTLPDAPSFFERVRSWLWHLTHRRRVETPSLPFAVGDRVRDIRGHVGTVTSIDLAAEHGLGSVRVRFDDGRELNYAAIAHDLECV